MAKKQITFDTPFRKGDKVTATVALPHVPEGTSGTVKLVNGITWTRYWVFFDNGVDMGSIDQKALVRAKQWGDYQTHRSQAATTSQSTTAASGASAAAAADGAAPAAGGSRIPEHLLERSKNRRKALGIG